jgi:hypothetical protein
MSACVLIWAAGRTRAVSGVVVLHCAQVSFKEGCNPAARQSMISYLQEMGAPPKLVALQEATGPMGLWASADDLAEPVPLPRERPTTVAQADEPPVIEDEPPPPVRRRPRRYYGDEPPPYYGPPPGTIYIPERGAVVPCLLPLITGGLIRFCI